MKRGDRTAVWLGAAAMALYVATWQPELYGDGVFFEQRLSSGQWIHNHVLFIPLVRLLQLIASPVIELDPGTAMRVLSTLAGGVGVALTYLIGKAILPGRLPAAAGAATLAVLPGYWFFATATEVHAPHAALAAMLLLGLVRVVLGQGGLALTAVGCALTPASHTSGVAAGLPGLVALWRVPGSRTRVFGAMVAGGALFAVTYIWLLLTDEGLRHYVTEFSGGYGLLLERPSTIPDALAGAAGQLLLFSAPASTLVPAGLLILARRNRSLAWLLGAWMTAWLVVALPVPTRETGAYYVVTYAAQVTVAMLAVVRMGARRVRLIVGCLLALIPAGAALLGETQGLVAWLVCASALVALVALMHRSPRDEPARWVWLLPAVAIVFSAVAWAPQLVTDPKRERMLSVAELVGPDSFVMLIEGSQVDQLRWIRYLPDRRRVVNLGLLDFMPADAAESTINDYLGRVRTGLAEGRRVYVVGRLSVVRRGPRLTWFFDVLNKRYKVVGLPRGPVDTFQVVTR